MTTRFSEPFVDMIKTRFRMRTGHRSALLAFLLVSVGAGCESMQGVNVGASVPIGGVVGVGVSKTVGQSSGQEKRTQKPKPAAGPGIKLYVFDCGALHFSDVTPFGLSNSDTDVRDLFVPCYLIEHPTKGRLLWDAGLPPTLLGKGVQPLQEGSTQEYRVGLVEQLKHLGLAPGDIDFVAFSHMHFDHVGSANEFVNSTLLIQEAEYEAAFKHPEDNPIFEFDLYNQLAKSTKILLTGNYDVFGDGTAEIISAAGHTPGHQVLLLKLSKTGPLLLGGDLYHFEASRKLRAVPEFNTSKEQTLDSMAKIEALIKQAKATLWIEHDMQLANRLKLAPAYYD